MDKNKKDAYLSENGRIFLRQRADRLFYLQRKTYEKTAKSDNARIRGLLGCLQ